MLAKCSLAGVFQLVQLQEDTNGTCRVSTNQQLKDLAVQYPGVEVTRADSLNAGNCESGTDDFIEEILNGRKSVKVSDLAPYIDDYSGVRTVLEFKFRQLEQ